MGSGSSIQTGKNSSASSPSKTSKTGQKETKSDYIVEPKDVMISYSHADKDMMNKLKDALEKHGISVWVDTIGLKAGVDFLSKIGQAIIDAKLFISLLSEKSIASKYCQDELALAYISNKPIFPCGLKTPEELFPLMDTGMKLQLARFEWNLFTEEDAFESNFDKLANKMDAEISKMNIESHVPPADEASSSKQAEPSEKGDGNPESRQILKRQDSVRMNQRFDKNMMGRLDSFGITVKEEDFWSQHYPDQNQVEWIEFSGKFKQEYKSNIDKLFSEEDQTRMEMMMKHEMAVEEDGILHVEKYKEFCTIDKELFSLWQRVQDYALEHFAMREVFNMDSHVRVEAIENLGKFNSPAVREALRDLLKDSDPNVRAVAAISLARAAVSSDKVTVQALKKILTDQDRLVRESGCLALGHLKSQGAVGKLVQMWRNDVISTVRDAAQLALEQIGGEEANKAIHMTKVLAEEIQKLTKS